MKAQLTGQVIKIWRSDLSKNWKHEKNWKKTDKLDNQYLAVVNDGKI